MGAPVRVGPDRPVDVDQQHGLTVDHDSGHIAFPQVIEVDRFPPSPGRRDLHVQPVRTVPFPLAVLSSSPARKASRAVLARAAE